jgi:hypothetical protein
MMVVVLPGIKAKMSGTEVLRLYNPSENITLKFSA